MAKWTSVGSDEQLQPGSMAAVTAGERTILLVRLDDGYYALDERCPHLRAHLANGTLRGNVIECPAHGSRFDARSGQSLDWTPSLPGLVSVVARKLVPPRGLRTYPTKREGGQVWVDLEPGAEG